MAIKERMMGSNMDRIPDIAFRGMSFLFWIWGIFASPGKKLKKFGIKPGDTVVDFGCGPGNYIKDVSLLAGGKGVVYAADIHELAIKAINKKISRYNLKNVKPVLVRDYKCDIPDNSADVIYALDMFHMVKQPDLLLKELHRMLKKDGKLFIDDGHQPRKESKRKIEGSKLWSINEEFKGWLVCTPA
ncbi:MAG: class I SAM-dependent methyltransferase [Spirochaetes bacterium]|nr:class I SAM-dependent methyltransferase [Spirochaetota bacterium]